MADTWVLVADSSAAHVYSGKHLRAPLKRIESMEHEASRQRGVELMSDAPGRVHNRFGPGRHSLDPREQIRSEEAQRFARDLAARLASAHHEGRFDRLVIMAAPAFLGVLRTVLAKPLLDVLVAEVPKNLVDHDVADVEAHIP
ncbi:MAG: host attachment protein [Chromatiales bacterium]|nr:host attachment protein [Chromatiales bacterium]